MIEPVANSSVGGISAQLILADSAQTFEGKVDMMGAGWYVTHTPTPVSALVGMLSVPADRAGEVLPLTTVLLDDAGQPVMIGQTADAPGVQLRFETALDLTAATEVLPGMNVRASFAVAVPSLPLRPGRYVWSATVGGHHFATDFIVTGEAEA